MVGKISNGVGVPHVILVSYPGQGHVNPLLRIGKILATNGLLVTLTAPETIGEKIRKANNNVSEEPTPFGNGMTRFEFFDDESHKISDPDMHAANLERVGKLKLARMIQRNEEEGRPVSYLIYSCFVPWVSEVAEAHQIPCAPLWVQSCACFSAYYHYYHSLAPFPTESHPEIDVQLPYMPALKHDEIPSFLHPSCQWPSLRISILAQFKSLSKSSCVLIDTFEELEHEEIRYMSKLCNIKPIGPLFKYPVNKTLGGAAVSVDTFKTDDCTDWMDSKPASSVVYISFGSAVVLKQEQVTEIAYGLLNSGVSFLWVVRRPAPNEPVTFLPDGFLEMTRERGRVVQWSQQQQVLAHPAITCFVTHCGWNSTMEAIASGVPVVAFPQLGDQVTDAKYLLDVFKVGVRLSRGDFENRVIPRDEVEKALQDATTGPKAAEIRENALKWKNKADEAVAEGGSSNLNMQEFLNGLTKSTLAFPLRE